MKWSKALLGGVVAGIALTVADFIMHGMIMAGTYEKYPVFTQEQANPGHFALIAVLISVFAALLFARTRNSWGPGLGGGLAFGFALGMVGFFGSFYSPLVLEGFPYHLSWCWGGINLIGFLVVGAILGLFVKKT
jgi:hypothetical protein